MRVFGFETGKLLFHQRGMVIVVLYLLFQFGLLLGSTADNPDAVLHQEGYDYYLAQVSGPYTEEKAAFLEEESRRITQAKALLNSLYQEYYSGMITEPELRSRAEEYQSVLHYEGGFNVVYDQYLYVCEGKENRCFVDTNGWAGLLGTGALDLSLVLVVILLAAPVFCREYACKMDSLALTTLNGRKNYVRDKILLVLLMVSAVCLAGVALQCCFYAFRYGLPHGDYTIQSVKIFGSSTKRLSLWEAFGLLTIFRLYGALFLALMVLAAAALSRQYAMTVFLPSVCVFIPWMGLPKQLQYMIPFPLPFLLGTGFIQGNSVTTDALTGEKITAFQELNAGDIIRLLFLSVIVCLLCLWVIRWRNRTVLSRSRRSLHYILALALASVLALGGCSAMGPKEGKVNFNSHTSGIYEIDDYYVYIEKSTLWVENLSTGEVTELIRNPLTSGYVGLGIFGIGHDVFYTLIQNDSYAGKLADSTGNVSQISVMQINLDTFEETVAYEKQQVNTVLGINIKEGDLPESLYIGYFFLSENAWYVFYNGVRRIDLRTGKTTMLDIPASSNVAFDGVYIYYVDSQYALCRLDPEDGKTTRWTDIAVYDFCLNEDVLYYIDMRLGNKLYAMSTDGTGRILVLDKALLAVESRIGGLTITEQNGDVGSLNLE